MEPLYIAAEKGQLPELKRVIVGFGERIAMDATLEGALARVFGGALPPAGTAAAPRVPEEAEGSVKALLEAAASASLAPARSFAAWASCCSACGTRAGA